MKVFFYITLLGLSSCLAQTPPSPIMVTNPLHMLKQYMFSSVEPPRELLEFAKGFPQVLSNAPFDTFVQDDKCFQDLVQFYEDLKQLKLYSIKMLDASGKPDSGIFQGNLKWPGRYYECLDIKTTDFSGKYFGAYLGAPPTYASFGIGVPTGVTIGLCLPDTCSIYDVTAVVKNISVPIVQNLTVMVSSPVQLTEWGTKEILGLIVLILLACLVFASTLYEYISNRENVDEDSDKAVLYSSSPSTQIKHGKLRKLFTSFSIIKNGKHLLCTKQRPTDITCLHGIRFLSMSWVMLGHSFLFSVSYSDNLKFMADYFVDHFEFQAIGNATVSVDSFFYLSGLLVSYLGLRELTKRDGKMNVPLMYLHRYIRLTPAFAFLILMSISLWPKFGNGPMWPSLGRTLQIGCNKYWWSNLLYIQNLYPPVMEEECYGWGWYLANDTQFYLLSPLFLMALYKAPAIGLALCSFVLTASMAVTGAFSSVTQQQPQPISIGVIANFMASPKHLPQANEPLSSLGDAPDPTQYSIYLSDLYTKPWCRIGAYMVGIITGYILHANKNKVKMPKIAVVLGWIVAIGTNCAIIYCLYPSFSHGQQLNNNTAAFYNAVSRPVWCMGLAWLTIACVSGYGGPVNSFLSWKGFMPLSRLTYCSYLIHPLVIWWLVGTGETLIHYSIQAIMMVFLTAMVLANMLAFVIALLIEVPVIELLRLMKDDGEKASVYLTKTIQLDNDFQVGEEHHA